MQQPCYHIATATDDRYYVPAYTMLLSLFENNKDLAFYIYIFHSNLNTEQKKGIESLATKYGSTVQWIEMNNKQLESYPLLSSQYQSIATYYRVFVANLLPDKIQKFLYLDVDIIIKESIKPLLDMELGDTPLFAVKEAIPDYVPRLGIPAGYDCFNAGVLLFNLPQWRKYNYTTQLITSIADNESNNLKNDQEVLNAMFYKTVSFLHPKWNFQRWHYQLSEQQIQQRYGVSRNELLNNPSIIHFTGPTKPWAYMCTHPYKPLFIQHLHETPFKSFLENATLGLQLRKLAMRVKHKIHKILHINKSPSY